MVTLGMPLSMPFLLYIVRVNSVNKMIIGCIVVSGGFVVSVHGVPVYRVGFSVWKVLTICWACGEVSGWKEVCTCGISPGHSAGV